jgi:hypothetical protein
VKRKEREFYDLYSDRAVVHARVRDREQGILSRARIQGVGTSELLKEGKTGLDGSIFRDATVEQRGSRLIIRAKRYSTTRCYWDPAYQVGHRAGRGGTTRSSMRIDDQSHRAMRVGTQFR